MSNEITRANVARIATDGAPMRRGIIYSATGTKYASEALISARSLQKYAKERVVLFCDELADVQAAPSIQITRVATSGNPYKDKILAMAMSPFEETIYLDTDTFIVGQLEELFALLEKFDVVAAHAAGYRSCDDPRVPRAFFELNTGVVAYRNSTEVQRFLRSWLATYEEWVDSPPFAGAGLAEGIADQPAFRRCLWESGLRQYVMGPEFNYRLMFPGGVVDRVRLIHGRHADLGSMGAVLNGRPGARTFERFDSRDLRGVPEFKNIVSAYGNRLANRMTRALRRLGRG